MTERSKKKVSEVMSADFLVLDGLATVAEALDLMRSHDASFALIDKRDEHDEYGIVLVSDVAKQVLAKNRAPERVNVYEIMCKPVLCVQPGMNIRYCARLFERFGISTAPVVEGEKILGVVTYDTLVLKGLADDA
ncbi:MAG: CBS domain-containing protein [Gammaproteobacteria bacterium]|nr:CBS domain-containing protein [Gammaproteobacteria bacterium]